MPEPSISRLLVAPLCFDRRMRLGVTVRAVPSTISRLTPGAAKDPRVKVVPGIDA